MTRLPLMILGALLAFAGAGGAIAGTTGNSSVAIEPLTLHEYRPETVEMNGPDKAEGLLYFIDGLDKDNRGSDNFTVTYPLVSGFNSRLGWDVVVAKYPNDQDYVFNAIPRSALYVLNALKHFRAMGYKRVVLGGQSWGAWTSMDVAALDSDQKIIDALLLVAPANFGPRDYNGKPNEYFELNKTEYVGKIARVKTPTVAIFFNDDQFDPGGRGEITRDALAKNNVPLLLLDRPAGFFGHGGAWQPTFAYRFGTCIEAFLKKAEQASCPTSIKPDLDDSRSITRESQLNDRAEPVTLDDLDGKSLIFITREGFSSKRTFAGETAHVSSSMFEGEEKLSMKKDTICIEKQCRRIYAMPDGSYISFDRSGRATSWVWPATQ